MKMRQARPDDATAICAITNALIRNTTVTFNSKERSKADVAADISTRGNAYWVAEQDSQILGFATFGPFRGGPGYARTKEHTIQLAPQARGQGIGRALMQRIETVAHEQRVHVMIAGISSDNAAGLGFHTAMGFAEVAHMPEVGFKFGRWLDLVLMQKILT